MAVRRTYYVVEMGCASYPPSEMHAQTRPYKDAKTQDYCRKVRAATKAEAEELVWRQIKAERYEACVADCPYSDRSDRHERA